MRPIMPYHVAVIGEAANGVFIPRKHTVSTYRNQQRKKRR